MADGKVIYEVRADDSKLAGDLSKAQSTAQRGAGKFGQIAGGTAKAIGKGMLAVGATGIAAGVAITKVGTDFESAFAGVKKTVDATEEELATLRKGILDMSTEMPAAAVEIATVAEAAGQLGIETDNILGFTESMINLGVATADLSAEEAATQLAQFANITQMSQKDFDKLGSVITELGNNTATTEGKIVGMGMRLAGSGKQAGMTEADIMGISAGLSSLGIEAEAGGTAFSKVITDMNLSVQRGDDKLEEFAKVAGMSAGEFAELFEKDAAGALSTFIEGLSTGGESAVMILDEMGISEIRMRDALLRASGAGDMFSETLKMSSKAWGENTALQKEADAAADTTANKFEVLKNKVTKLGIEGFEKLQPILVVLIDKISDVFAAMEDSGVMDSLMEAIALLGGALGDILIALLPVVADLIKQLVPPMMELIEAVLPVITDLFIQLLPPIMELIELLLPILTELLVELIPIFVEIIGMILPPLIDLFTMLLPPLVELIQLILPPLIALFEAVMPIIGDLITSLLPPLVEVFMALIPPLLELVDVILPILATLFEAVIPIIDMLMPLIVVLAELFGGVLGGAIALVMPIIEVLMDILSGLINFIVGVFSGNWEQAWDGIVGIFKGIFNLIPSIIEGIINGAIGLINGLIKGINKITGVVGISAIPEIANIEIPRFRTGLDFVPYDDFPALLHQGEMVLTAREAELWRTAGATPSTVGQMGSTGGGGAADVPPIVIQLNSSMEVDGDILGQKVDEYHLQRGQVTNGRSG